MDRTQNENKLFSRGGNLPPRYHKEYYVFLNSNREGKLKRQLKSVTRLQDEVPTSVTRRPNSTIFRLLYVTVVYSMSPESGDDPDLKGLIQSSPDAIVIANPETNEIFEVNQAAEELFGIYARGVTLDACGFPPSR